MTSTKVHWWDDNFRGKIKINTRVHNLEKRCPGCMHLKKNTSFRSGKMLWCDVSRAIAVANMFGYDIQIVE